MSVASGPVSESARYSVLRQSLGGASFDLIKSARVLVVGAGGIGCEVLKNLAMCGVGDVHVIDLDTIDVSNLNRQFLFRKEHVGQSKAIVAAGAANKFNPAIKITPYHGNIKEDRFDVHFFGGFKVVLSALDNVDARRHLNRMCLAAGVTLLESGTTGYLGQVVPIRKGETECYECSAKPTQKVYPICTIRSTPDKPVHCIVWAKELYKLLFGNAADSMLFSDPSVSESAESQSAHFELKPASFERVAIIDHVTAALRALYITDINLKLSLDVYKTSKVQPEPLSASLLDEVSARVRSGAASLWAHSSSSGWEQAVWASGQSLEELYSAAIVAYSRIAEHTGGLELTFDKDDKLSMKFVTAAANLRAAVFGIPLSSYYDAKGLQVSQALSILRNPAINVMESCKMVFCQRFPNRLGQYLQSMPPDPPKSTCFVCSLAQLSLQIDTTAFTLQDFVSKVLRGRLGFVEPTVQLGASIVYEEGEDCDDSLARLLPRRLCDLPAGGIRNGSIVNVEDFRQDLTIAIVVTHRDDIDEKEVPELFVIGGSLPSTSTSSSTGTTEASTSSSTSITGVKRGRDDDSSSSSSSSATTVAAQAVTAVDADDVAIVFTEASQKKPTTTTASSTASTTTSAVEEEDDDIIVVVEKKPRVE